MQPTWTANDYSLKDNERMTTPTRRLARVRALLTAAACVGLAGVAACAPRQVEVRTAATQATQVSLQVNNNLAQAVNVYVILSGTDTFLRQVPANSSVTIPVQGFAPGSTVSLRAVTIDGGKTYSRTNVVLSGTYVFPLP
ncbi:MAG: hypothetical protein ACHQWU_11345 [Gemmatimonadales bacterium]